MNKTYLTFEQISKNKSKTIMLIFFMAVIVVSFCYLLGYLFNEYDPASGMIISLFIAVVIFLISFGTSKMSMLSGVRGREASPGNPADLKIIRMVENLAVSAGIPTPKVYILPTRVPNAFASGYSPKSAFVGVTQGLIDIMDEEELMGVLAHEIAHIANYDVRVCMVGFAMVAILAVFSNIAFRLQLFGGGSRSKDNKGNTALILFIIIIAAFIARLLANMINLAISRKREYIADAHAVRLCSNNRGLANALRKLSGGAEYTEQDVSELGGSHMLGMYINQKKRSFAHWFSTHPPIEERIKILMNMA